MLLLPASWLLSEVGSEIGSIGVHCCMQAVTDESQGTAVAQPTNLNMLEQVTILTKRAGQTQLRASGAAFQKGSKVSRFCLHGCAAFSAKRSL